MFITYLSCSETSQYSGDLHFKNECNFTSDYIELLATGCSRKWQLQLISFIPILLQVYKSLLWQLALNDCNNVCSHSSGAPMSPRSLGQAAVLKLAFRGGWAGLRRRRAAPPHPSPRVRRQDAQGSKTRRSVPVWQLLLPLICIVFCFREDGTKGHTHTHTPWVYRERGGLLESITVWVLQLGALQSLLSDMQKLLVRGVAVSLMSSCRTNNWILQTEWRKVTWCWVGGQNPYIHRKFKKKKKQVGIVTTIH